MIYTDGKDLYASSLDELHKFAGELGLAQSAFVDVPGAPFYILMGAEKVKALAKGAILKENKEIFHILKNNSYK